MLFWGLCVRVCVVTQADALVCRHAVLCLSCIWAAALPHRRVPARHVSAWPLPSHACQARAAQLAGALSILALENVKVAISGQGSSGRIISPAHKIVVKLNGVIL